MQILRMTEAQHQALEDHLMVPDGLEAVAVALCGVSESPERRVFTVHEIYPVPHADCDRGVDHVAWPTAQVYALLERARELSLRLLKVHSHPRGQAWFSDIDDKSDAELLSACARRLGGDQVSAVLLPNGRLFARTVDQEGSFGPVDRVAVIGEDIRLFDADEVAAARDFDIRHRQMFGDRTTDLLGRLSIGVAGVSGTGSPLIEMLARLGLGRLVLADDDVVETKNLNRIYGATAEDVEHKTPKATMMAAHLERIGLGTVVVAHVAKVDDPKVQADLATCDLVFGCMDSIEGRDALFRLAARACLPYLDIGVRLDADGLGGVNSVSAAIHYLRPGGSSLKSRGVYTNEELYAEHLYRTDPEFYADQVQRGYIKGVRVDRPAVISINTTAASMAVNEALSRLHPYRSRPNGEFAVQRLLLSHGRMVQQDDGEPDEDLAAVVGLGVR